MKFRSHQFGLSLIELMVALAIGSVLIAGAVFVYIQSRNSFAINDSVARLQEAGRYAFSVLEPDIRMGGFWGLINDPELVDGRARQSAAPAAVATGNAHVCGNNFAVDLYDSVQGTDASYSLTCAAFGAGVPASSDTLTIRRANTSLPAPPITATLPAGTLRVWSNRISGRLFTDGVVPGVLPPAGQVNNLSVNSYYVSLDSGVTGSVRAGIPSLRRKALIAGPDFEDQEIVPGVEDLQVQFGIDPTGRNESATQYLNAGTALSNAINAGAQVIAVRIWILVRAETIEVGYTNTTPYQYGNRNFTPGDGFRRVLMSRTIQLRNSLG